MDEKEGEKIEISPKRLLMFFNINRASKSKIFSPSGLYPKIFHYKDRKLSREDESKENPQKNKLCLYKMNSPKVIKKATLNQENYIINLSEMKIMK